MLQKFFDGYQLIIDHIQKSNGFKETSDLHQSLIRLTRGSITFTCFIRIHEAGKVRLKDAT